MIRGFMSGAVSVDEVSNNVTSRFEILYRIRLKLVACCLVLLVDKNIKDYKL